jgi:ketosteroid isomerase-like protein
MSQENVEIMRASNEAWVAADSARLREMYDPGVVMRTEQDWPEAGPHFGREAVLRFLEELRGTWESGELEEISLIDAGDRIVCRQRWHGVGRGPDAYLEVTAVTTFRNSKIVMIEYFWDHKRALEAVGLPEQNDRLTALPTVPVDDKIRILDAGVEAMNAREVNEALLTDDFEIVNASTAVTDKTYRGASGAREWLHDFFDVLDENARYEILEIVEAGDDYLVVRNRLVGMGSASGVPFDMEWCSAWWFRDGRAARTVGYNSRRAALAAVHGDAHADS